MISVVIPTRDRPQPLEECLAALDRQSASARLEVVVVDDGSAAQADIAAVVARHPQARLVRLDGRGPAAARNAGSQAAEGDVVVFIDDDCVADEAWAERLAAAVAHADAVGGMTLDTGGPLAQAAELIAHAPAATVPFAPSNNLACSRRLITSEPFDETFPDAAGEDREWCARIVGKGYLLAFEHDARVTHRQKVSLASFIRRQYRYGRGAYRFRSAHGGTSRLERPGFYAGLVRRGFAVDVRVGILVVLAQAATAAGWISMLRDARRSPPGRRPPT
jgi:glycosyltransferase involved in cell wall biosynthesis